jgi:hypothetical protein
MVFFTSFIMVVKESFMQLLVAGILFFMMPVELNQTLQELSPKQHLNNKILAIAALALTIVAYPVSSVWILVSSKKHLSKRSIRKRIGYLYYMINLNTWVTRMYPLVYVFRRLLILILIMWVSKLKGIQVMTQLYLDTLILVYVGNQRPFKSRMLNNLNLINEAIILNLTTLMMLFTDFCTVRSAQYNLGWIFIIEVILFIFVSFMIMLKGPVRTLYLHIVKNYRIVKWKTMPLWAPILRHLCCCFQTKMKAEIEEQDDQ